MVKAVKVVTKGTKTSTGGVVLEGHENCTFGGQPATSVGQRASCGRCGKIGLIAANGNHETYLPDGKQAATPHCRVLCDCANNYLLEPSHNAYIGDSRGAGTGQVFLGGNVHFGDNVFINTGSTNASPIAQASQISQGDPIVPPKPKRRPEFSLENAAQQAYDLTEKEWESDLQSDLKTYLENNQHIVVIYSLDDAVSVLKALAEKYGKTVKEIGAIAAALYKVGKSTYDAAKIAKSFGDFGMKVKPFLDKNGNERISISTKNQSVKHVMSNGVRVKLNSSKSYSVANAKVIQAGISPKVRTGKYKGSVLITFVVSASINTKDLILDDDFLLEDWLGNVGSDLFKAAISIGAGECAILLLPTLPFIVEAFVCAAVASSLAYAYDYFEVDDLILKVLGNE